MHVQKLLVASLLSFTFAHTVAAQDAASEVEVAPEVDSPFVEPPPPPPPAEGTYVATPPPPPGTTYVQTSPPVVAPVYVPEETIEGRARNTVFGEGFGAGILYSLNYERLVHEDVALRVGFGFVGFDAYDPDGGSARASLTLVPLSVSYLGIGSTNHIFEIGGGATLAIAAARIDDGIVSRSSGFGAFGTAFAGYRYHPSEPAGFHFRAGLMALIARGLNLSDDDPNRFGAVPWPYVGAGASF
ncbi:MAG: hypothetical protein H6722_11895 [Sandaracinus sp.]|nr:hypothetical protein [Sandaracinus sp.]